MTGYEIHKKARPRINLSLYLRLYGEEPVRGRRFYNIGAGSFRHPAWTNVDHFSEWYAPALRGGRMIDWDLMSLTPLPVESNSAEAVYTSHTIEHVTNEADAYMFREAHRTLKRGAHFRIVAPDVELIYGAYQRGDADFLYWIDMYSEEQQWRRVKLRGPMNQESLHQAFLWSIASSASVMHADGSPDRIDDGELARVFSEAGFERALDHCCSKCSLEVQRKYPGNHCNWFTKRKLSKMLREAGFGEVYVSGYGQSRCPVMRDTRLFDSSHPEISLFVEAVK